MNAPRQVALHVLRRLAERMNYDLVWRDYYSPIPALDSIPPAHWSREHDLPGIDWRAPQQRHLYDNAVLKFDAEFEQAIADRDGAMSRYAEPNRSYEGLDARVLYGLLRSEPPRRVIELGGGYSSLVIATALARNAADGVLGDHRTIEPFPSQLLIDSSEWISLDQRDARDVSLEEFAGLRSGDVLFIDTTHTVKAYSEVNFLLLDVVPRLAPGVRIHIHDIFLPREYPRVWLEERGYYWAEQYLVHALLVGNLSLQVELSASWLGRALGGSSDAGALWLRTLAAH